MTAANPGTMGFSFRRAHDGERAASRGALHSTPMVGRRTRGRDVRLGLLFAVVSVGCSPAPKSEEAPGDHGSCTETRTAIGLPEQTALGLSPEQLLPLAAGTHTRQLTWSHGASTEITLAVDASNVSAEFVLSERDPTVGVVPELGCDDAIDLVVAATLATSDGRLDEKWTSVTLTFRPREELAPDGGWTDAWLDGSRKLESGAIGGSYEPSAPPESCLLEAIVAVHLKSGTAKPTFSGAVQRLVADAPCDKVGDSTVATPILDATW